MDRNQPYPRTIMILSFLAIFSLASFGFAGGAGEWWNTEDLQKKLELTPEQIEKIAEVEARYQPRIKQLKIEKRKSYRSMVRLLDREDISVEKYNEARDRMKTAYGDSAAESAGRWHELRSILTMKQWRMLPETAPKVLQLGSIAVASRSRVTLGGPAQKGTPKQKSGQ